MTDTGLERIAAKVAAGEPLTADDIEMLTGTADLLALGAVADDCRRARRGDEVTFVRVLEVELPGGPLNQGAPAPDVPGAAGEVRLSGSFGDIDRAVAAVTRVRESIGDVPVTGFVLHDVAEACGGGATALGEALTELREAGLSALADAHFEQLDGPDLVATAAAAGVPVTRISMAGAGFDAAGLRRVADWGSELTGVKTLAPLPRTGERETTTGYRDVRQVALARLLVNNIEAIQVDWRRDGPKLAQVALTFGANDVDAVSPYDTVEQGRRRAPLEEITRNIRGAGLTPVERNGRFERR